MSFLNSNFENLRLFDEFFILKFCFSWFQPSELEPQATVQTPRFENKLYILLTLLVSFHAMTTSSVQLLSHVQLFATPWTSASQASLSITKNSQSLLKLMSIESLMPSNHLILCCPLLLPPSIFPSIRVFSNESVLRIRWPKYWSFNFGISPFQ